MASTLSLSPDKVFSFTRKSFLFYPENLSTFSFNGTSPNSSFLQIAFLFDHENLSSFVKYWRMLCPENLSTYRFWAMILFPPYHENVSTFT